MLLLVGWEVLKDWETTLDAFFSWDCLRTKTIPVNSETFKVTVYLQVGNFLQIWIFGSK